MEEPEEILQSSSQGVNKAMGAPKASGMDAKDQSGVVGEQNRLKRKLKSRHLQMIAMGGAIGTGLFIGSGSALARSGPVGCLIAYCFVGTIVFSVMVSLGEMVTYIPVAGAFTTFAARFVDPSLAFAMGWIYWFSWAITFALELTVAGLIIQYWHSGLSIGIFIAVFWIIFTGTNLVPVSFYGELEFWFSSIKVVTILGFMIFAICIDAGVGKQGYLGFWNWAHPGPFAEYLITGPVGKFVGFWAVLIQAVFSFQGTELVGIAAGETDNPHKTVPSAIKKTFWRILFFFCLTIFFIGLLVPYDNPDLLRADSNAAASPLVIAINLAGIEVLPSAINAVLLTAVLSAANSNVYSGSRILIGLSHEGFAPSFFARTSKRGVPYYAVACTSVWGLLAFLNLDANGGQVFNWLLNITAVAGLITWACLNWCHLRFIAALKAQNIDRATLPYTAPWQPWLTWYGLGFNMLILLTQGFTSFIRWDTKSFFAAHISLILFVVLFVVHKFIKKTKAINPAKADLDTGRLEVEEMVWYEKSATAKRGKAWAWLV